MRWMCLVGLLVACGDDDGVMNPDAGMDGGVDVGVDAPTDAGVDALDVGVDSGLTCGLIDDFEDPATLACWTAENMDFADAVIADGSLQITFREGSPARYAWFGDDVGPALTQRVRGNILAVLEVDAHRVGEPDLPPTGEFNSAGFLLRDPASSSPGNQNWIMWNTGSQGTSNCVDGSTTVDVGSEGKTTINSSSNLCLNPGSHRGRLAICRVGPSVRLMRKLEGDDAWTEVHAYERSDFPDELDIGVLANAWATGPDLHAEFGSIFFSVPANLDGCSASVLERDLP